MSAGIKELKGLNVIVDRVVYAPEFETPPERPYAFVYSITISNQSQESVTVRGRKWVVTESDGTQFVVEGDGVVGEFPHLAPGEHFSYKSYMTVATDSFAEGSYLALTDEGRPVLTRIPRFWMRVLQ
jgi:ApaG protein